MHSKISPWIASVLFASVWLVPVNEMASRLDAAELDAWRDKLTFHASFDNGPNADFAAGDGQVYTASDTKRTDAKAGLPDGGPVSIAADGRWGSYLKFSDVTKSVVFFKGQDNVPYAQENGAMTYSFWMRLDPDADLKPGYVDPLQVTDKAWNNASLFVDFTKDDSPRHFRLGVFSDYKFWNPEDTPWDDVAAKDRPMVVVEKTPFSREQWTHVAITLEQLNSGQPAAATLYLDGKSQGTLVRPLQLTWDPAKLAVMLGIQYIGGLDDFAVFRGAMSASEIEQLANTEGGVATLVPGGTQSDTANWIPLFNGKDLTDWVVKIRGHEVGKNFGNTFRVEDGLIKVRYDAYPEFKQRFGHIFYKQPYSSYDLRVEYRFVGEQTKGGPGWAFRNSGLMLHGQDPATMTLDQDFPVSIEVQLLGGNGKDPRTTLNLCTPGTNVEMNGELFLPHCTSSSSPTYHGDQWVTVLVRVRGNRLIEHVVDGRVVLSYQKPQLDGRDANAKRLLKSQPMMLDGGTISLQSESHPVEFRKVELRPVNE